MATFRKRKSPNSPEEFDPACEADGDPRDAECVSLYEEWTRMRDKQKVLGTRLNTGYEGLRAAWRASGIPPVLAVSVEQNGKSA